MPDRSAENLRRLAPAEIKYVAFGVRYEPQYKVMDQIGTVIDEILRADGTPFGPETFPLTDPNPLQYRLLDDQTDSYLLISSQDAILQFQVDTKNESRVDDLANGFQDYVLRQLRDKVGVKNIHRYGVMFRFQEQDANLFQNPPVTCFLSPEFPNANGMVMHFTRRLGVEEALARQGVDDYRNVIHSVSQTETGKVQLSIDYQEYFDPLLDRVDWDARPFPRFVAQGTEYVHGEFEKWLQKLEAVAEVV